MGQSVSSLQQTNMQSTTLVLAFLLGCVYGDGLTGHSHNHGRSGRQDAAVAPLGGYEADLDTAASDDVADPLAMLHNAIPGIPGEDYPIYSEAPESGFECDGQVDGGYYADPEAECQAFHICTADGAGGLAKYSFLCPNGTLFNQNYFICDWWFNFDCSTAEDLYSLNDEIAAERDALAGAASDEGLGSYEAPAEYAPAPVEDYADYEPAAADYAEEVDYGYEAPAPAPAPVTEAASDYEQYDDAGALGVYGEETTVAPVDSYLPPVEGRRGRRLGGNRGGRRGGRRNQRRPTQGRRQFRG